MLRKLRFVLLVLGVSAWYGDLVAQQITPELSASWGWFANIDDQQFDMSVGELGTTTITNGSYTITQGFHQPIDLFTPCAEFQLSYYPNPVRDRITILSTGCDLELGFIEAYDTFGKIISSGATEGNQVDLTALGVGVYLLRAYTVDMQAIGTVKIVKTTI